MTIVDGFSIEALPRTATLGTHFREMLPAETRVYIAHVPGTPIDEMVTTAGHLGAQGFPVMPHVPARLIDSSSTLEEWLERYRDAGVGEGFPVMRP